MQQKRIQNRISESPRAQGEGVFAAALCLCAFLLFFD